MAAIATLSGTPERFPADIRLRASGDRAEGPAEVSPPARARLLVRMWSLGAELSATGQP